MSQHESHSEEIARELENCRQFLTEAQNNGDVARVMQILRVFAGLHKDVEKARLRESKYLTEEAVAAHDAKFYAEFVGDMQGMLQRVYDHELTAAQAWEILVDKTLEKTINA